jgi:hypothetical protein
MSEQGNSFSTKLFGAVGALVVMGFAGKQNFPSNFRGATLKLCL